MKLSQLKGIGEKSEKLFNKLGIYTIEDLLHTYPRDYETFEPPILISQIKNEYEVAICGKILIFPKQKKVNNLMLLTATILDEAGASINVTWFNMPFLKNQIKLGVPYVFRGKINRKYGIVLEQPMIYKGDDYTKIMNAIQPKYALTNGLTNNLVKKAVRQILDNQKNTSDILPIKIREKYHLAEYSYSLKNIHFPTTHKDLIAARNRLVFEEFFYFIATLRKVNENKTTLENDFIITTGKLTNSIIEQLPYALTGAQERVLKEIQQDLSSKKVMSRLIQGDVGSGKTIVAVLALIDVIASGYQGAFMVPTEVLANQHYQTITTLLEEYKLSFTAVLLTGSMNASAKKKAYQLIKSGEAHIIIGTHALIQENVEYQKLALVITDEQHRFGVRQRELFSKKGNTPNILVMSATPIPRTLALILYGDLDISVIDELPSNRKPIKNCVVETDYRPNAYRFIINEVKKGRQAYVICPMVEESESIDAENVIEYAERLKEELGSDIVVAYLHGKMKAKEKNEIMDQFLNGKIQVLVSTTVIEVGVNVPNASVMMIENAERFGLATLHQLRGRVGRGKEQSYCIFVSGTSKKETLEKLEILNKSNDGFVIANEDLKSRGPGDLFGIRQSGDLHFKIGDIYQDAEIIKNASKAVEFLYEKNTNIKEEELELIEKKCQLTKELLLL